MNTIEKGTVAKGVVAKGELNLSDFATTGVIGIRITSGNLEDTIAENSGADQVIYTATAEDPNGGTTGFTFSLTSNSDSEVSINSSTGAVTLADNPNFEAKTSYAFTVIASKGDFIDGTKTLTQHIGNADETAPTFTSGTSGTAIIEGSLVGTLIYTATATDSDDFSGGIVFSITGGDSGDLLIENVTESGVTTGLVKMGVVPDYAVKPSYSFDIVVTDLVGNSVSQTITFNILDANPPVFTSGTSVTVPESDGTSHSITTASTVLYTAQATDANPALDGSGRYQITTDSGDGADGGLLNIDQDSGEVTLASGALDYSTKSSYVFTVKATDRAGNFAKQTVTLTVEQLPRFSTGSPHNVAENLSVNNVTIHGYSITGGTASDVSIYQVDGSGYSVSGSSRLIGEVATTSSTGIIRTEGFVTFDYETATSHTAVLRGVKTGTGSVFFSENIVYNVLNTNDNAPVITSGGVATSIAENSGANQVVYQVTSTDADGTGTWSSNNQFTLGGADASSFSVSNALNATYGEVTLLDNPDYENKSSYTFTITATDDNGSGNASAPQTVTLAITNVVDVVPTFTNSTVTAGTVAEANSTPPSTLIYDIDTNLNDPEGAVHTLNIPNVSTGFVGFYIDADHVIRTTNALDYETATSHDLTIVASYTLADGTNGSVGFTLTIPVSNVDEVAPVFTSSSANQNIGANIPVPVDVYTAVATDTDSNTGTITYSLSDDGNGYFEIDSSTGVVTMLTAPTNPSQGGGWRPQSADYQKSITIVASDGTNSTSMTKTFNSIVNLVFDSLSPTIAENYYDGGGLPPRTKYSPGGTPITTAQLLPGTALVESSTSAGTITDYTATNFTSTPGGATGLFTHNGASGNFQLLSLSTHDDLDFETNGGEIDVSYRVQKTGTGNEFVYQDVAFTITLTDAPACNFTSSATATAVTDGTGGGTVVYTATADIFDLQSGSVVFSKNPVLDQSDFSLNSTTGELTLTNNANYSNKSQYQVSLTAKGSLDASDNDALTVTIPVSLPQNSYIHNGEWSYPNLVRDADRNGRFRVIDIDFDVRAPGQYAIFLKSNPHHSTEDATDGVSTSNSYSQDVMIGAIQVLDATGTTIISSMGPQFSTDTNSNGGVRGFINYRKSSAVTFDKNLNYAETTPAYDQYTPAKNKALNDMNAADFYQFTTGPNSSTYNYNVMSSTTYSSGTGRWQINSNVASSVTGSNDGISVSYWRDVSDPNDAETTSTTLLPGPTSATNTTGPAQVTSTNMLYFDSSGIDNTDKTFSMLRSAAQFTLDSNNTIGKIRIAYYAYRDANITFDQQLGVSIVRNAPTFYGTHTGDAWRLGNPNVTPADLYLWGENSGAYTGWSFNQGADNTGTANITGLGLGRMSFLQNYSGSKTGGNAAYNDEMIVHTDYYDHLITDLYYHSSANQTTIRIDKDGSNSLMSLPPSGYTVYFIRNAGTATESYGGSLSSTRSGTTFSTITRPGLSSALNNIKQLTCSHTTDTDNESSLAKATIQNSIPGGSTDYSPVMVVMNPIS
ncbi:cadherin repeat domain-containing protein [bacterium]|nr:cadherin repeat domain-containing protein [bacterium]